MERVLPQTWNLITLNSQNENMSFEKVTSFLRVDSSPWEQCTHKDSIS